MDVVPAPAASVSRLFRVFVSSTFSDFEAERDVLRGTVFLPMSALLAQRGFELQVVDLRWGIGSDASLGQQTMRICLEQVRLCQQRSPRPNFLILTGDRYGWCPPPAALPAPDFDALCEVVSSEERDVLGAWYELDLNTHPPVRLLRARRGSWLDEGAWGGVEARLVAVIEKALARIPEEVIPGVRRAQYQTSGTEQEIERGLLGVVGAESHALAVRRTILDLENLLSAGPVPGLMRYVDCPDGRWNRAAWLRQQSLRDRVGMRFGASNPERLFDFACRYAEGHLSSEHLAASLLPDPKAASSIVPKTVPEAVWCGLWQVLLPEMEARERARDRLQSAPNAGHDEVARAAAQRCAEREALLAALSSRLESEVSRPVVVYGPSGVGKSTLLGAMVERLRRGHPDWLIVGRFIEAGPRCATAIALLDGLVAELRPPTPNPDRSPTGDPLSVGASAFLRALSSRRESPVVIILDALDQLPPSDVVRLGDWLPRRLQPGVRLLISVTSSSVDQLRTVWPEGAAHFVELGGLDHAGGGVMLDGLLASERRVLQAPQRTVVLAGFEQYRLPLWMDLAARQARRWTSSELAPPLPANPDELIGRWFDTLATAHGAGLVRRVLAYLAASRRGLTETALWELCSAEPSLVVDFLRGTFHVSEEFARHAPLHDTQADTGAWLAEVRSSPKALSAWAERLIEAHVPLPLSVWIRLHEDLAIYLVERDFFGAPLLDFHHARVRHVAAAQAHDPAEVHRHIATYFGARWRNGDVLALSELASHLARGELHAELADLLCDPTWQVLQLRQLGIGALLEAFAAADGADLDEEVRRQLVVIADAIRESAHTVVGSRAASSVGPAAEQLPGQLLGRLQGRTGSLIDRFLVRLAAWHREGARMALGSEPLLPVGPCLPTVSQRLQRTIAGHARPVVAVVLSPDGRTGVSCDDRCIVIWDPMTGIERFDMQVFDSDSAPKLTSLALAPEATRVLAWASDAVLRVYDLATGCAMSEWPAGAPGGSYGAGCTRTPLFVSVRGGTAVLVSSWEQPGPPALLFRADQTVTALCLDESLPVATFGFSDGGLAVWDLARQTQLGGGKTARSVRALAIDAAAEQVWWGDEDGGLGSWRYRQRAAEHWPERHQAAITGLGLCASARVISVARDAAMHVWSSDTGRLAEDTSSAALEGAVSTPVGHCYSLLAVATVRDRPIVATASEDTTVRVWNIDETDRNLPARLGHRSIVTGAAIDVVRQLALTVSKDGAILRWDLNDGRYLGALGVHVAHAGESWRPGDPARASLICSHLLLSSDGRHAISAGAGSLCWWDVDHPERACRHQVALPGQQVDDLLQTPSRELLLLTDGKLYRGDQRGLFAPHELKQTCRRLALSPDGRFLALVSSGGVGSPFVTLAQLATDHIDYGVALQCEAAPLAAAFLPDGRAILTVGHDRSVRLWETGSGRPLGIVGRHEREIWDVAVSADGKIAATVGDDRWVALWDLPGLRLRACFQMDGPGIRLALDPAARFIVTGDEAGRPVILRRVAFDREGRADTTEHVRSRATSMVSLPLREVRA